VDISATEETSTEKISLNYLIWSDQGLCKKTEYEILFKICKAEAL
jgi:hypothetical protein